MDTKIFLHLPVPQLFLDPYGHSCLGCYHPVLWTSLHDADSHAPASFPVPAGTLQGSASNGR